MTKINYRKICIQSLVAAILVVTVLVLQFGCLGVINAYAATSTVKPTKSDYYLDYSSGSLDTTGYYREAGVTNNVVEYGLGNGVFEWSSGASVMKDDLNTLVFQLNLKDPTYEYGVGLQLVSTFDVYSASKDGSNANLLFQLIYLSAMTEKNCVDAYFLRRAQYGTEKVGLVDCYNGVNNAYSSDKSALYSVYDFLSLYKDGLREAGYDFLGAGNASSLMRWSGTDEKHGNLAVKTSSAYTRYFVRAAAILRSEKEDILGNLGSGDLTAKTYEDICSCIDTSVVSVADVLGKFGLA